jgi:hypothetical protein
VNEPDGKAASELREECSAPLPPLAPPDVFDPVIEYYKQRLDRAAIRENLKRIREQQQAPRVESDRVPRLEETHTVPVPRLAPPDVFDPVVEAYKKDVDRTLIRENLKLTVEQRLMKLQAFVNFLAELRQGANRQSQAK